MTVTDLIYRTLEFFFNDFWHFIALLVLIFVIKGKKPRFFSGFFSKVRAKYRANLQLKPPKTLEKIIGKDGH